MTTEQTTAMLYRRFGRTELPMPVFSCGGMRYQMSWKDAPWEEIADENQANLEATIRRAVEVGINHIETARGYGSSERQLGKILPALPRERLIVQTKIAPEADPKKFIENFEISMERLQLDHVDLLGLHGINTPELAEWSLRPGGCLDAAEALQADGRVRFIGFSTHGPLNVILRAIESGRFDYVNLHWYYIFQRNWPAIEAARARDMGVFIISPSDKGGMLYKPSEKLIELCRPLSPIVFNDLFCLSRPEVHTLSVGAARPGDFDEHLKSLELLDRADELLPPIVEQLERAMREKLGERWMRTWAEGLPSHEATPGNVNIPVILWLRNLALAYDMIEYGKMRYNLLGNADHWFPGKKAEGIDDLDLQPCLARSPNADAIPEALKETHALLGGEEVQRLSEG